MNAHFSSRRGTILIIVAGISALMASLALAFLARMRSDVQESETLMHEAQAHIVLVAACNYIQEASRIGYDKGGSGVHPEAYGWIDIRDGAVGPKPTAITSSIDLPNNEHLLPNHGSDNDSLFPQQSVKRFEMFVKELPPFAIRLDVAPNAIDPNADGVPWLVEPDPKPRVSSSFTQFSEGKVDSTGKSVPRLHTLGKCWFRLLRCGKGPDDNLARYNAATFIVTCGAGETRGFRSRDWATMSADEQALFGGERAFLETLEASEIRLWYLVEWSPTVGGLHQFNLVHHRGALKDAEGDSFTFNQYSHFPPNHSFYSHSQTKERNFGGTIRMVQRLGSEPNTW
jgi:hypothetical protein